MLYYKQSYKLQSIFYPLSILLALLGGTMLIGCTTGNPSPEKLQEASNAGKQLGQQIVFLYKTDENARREILKIIEKAQEEKKISWVCKSCFMRTPLNKNICNTCNALRKINPAQEWACEACTFINRVSEKTCGACGSEAHNPQVNPNPEEKEECPVCFEEGKLQQGQHQCKQCKKAICEPCYQDLLKGKNKACPLCRYQEY